MSESSSLARTLEEQMTAECPQCHQHVNAMASCQDGFQSDFTMNRCIVVHQNPVTEDECAGSGRVV